MSEKVWTADEVQMLKDSYREVTGRNMPPYISPDEALAELRKALPVICTDEEELPGVTLKVVMAASKLKMRWYEAVKRRKYEASVSADAAASGWDEESYALLQASYREVTGSALPSYLSPDEAAAELRRLVAADIPIGMLANAADLPISALMAAVKLKKLLRHAALHKRAVRIANRTSVGKTTTGFGQHADPMVAAEAEDMLQPVDEALHEQQEQERVQQLREQLSESIDAGAVFRPTPAGAKLHSGWMTKKKALPKRSRSRWFVLCDSGELQYFDGDDELVQIGVISLKGLSAGSVREGKPGQILIDGAANKAGKIKNWVLEPGGEDGGSSLAVESALEWRTQIHAAMLSMLPGA